MFNNNLQFSFKIKLNYFINVIIISILIIKGSLYWDF